MRFHTLMILTATIILAARGAATADGWTAICNEPEGQGYEAGDLERVDGSAIISLKDGIIPTEDSFSNIRPAFFYRGNHTVEVIWGATKPDGISPELFETPNAETVQVISQSPNRLVTVNRYGDETWMTSHHPETGVAFATRHQQSRYGDLGYAVSTVTFPMECEYKRLQ